MTVTGWVVFAFLTLVVGTVWFGAVTTFDSIKSKMASTAIAVVAVAGIFFFMQWYFHNTASGQRELISMKSNLSNGIERTITVYTADGNVLAQYHGKIDIDRNDGGYILFDFEGKRYIYYNCFVESIADIE